MLTFGEWVRNKRISRNYNLVAAARYTGVDGSTLSRIENGVTEATIDTAIRISEGFGIEFAELITDLVGREVIENIQPDSTGETKIIPNVLKIEDLEGFVSLFLRDYDRGIEILGDLLEQASEFERAPSEQPFDYPFNRTDIHRLLLPDPIYQAELAYPSDFDDYEVLQTYHSGGVLTLADVGVYLRGKREASKRTLASMEKSAKRSASILSRLEGGELGRIKLQTALNLNQELGNPNNEILGMFWAAAQYQSVVSGKMSIGDHSVKLKEIGDILVTVTRWLQMQDNNGDWLRRLRDEM